MDDEHEVKGVCGCNPIEGKHCLDREMPRTGTVWSRDYHRNRANNKADKSAGHSQIGREVEAEKCEIVMQEIANPYSDTVKEEQRNAVDILYRRYS